VRTVLRGALKLRKQKMKMNMKLIPKTARATLITAAK